MKAFALLALAVGLLVALPSAQLRRTTLVSDVLVRTDSVRSLQRALEAETNRPRNLAPRKTVVRALAAEIGRQATQIDSIVLAFRPETVFVPAPPPADSTPADTTSPAPEATLSVSLRDLSGRATDTLRIRPASPYLLTAYVTVDSAGATIDDSALVTLEPADNARLWWYKAARRWEVYNATRPGVITAIVTRGSASATLTIIVADSTTPTPPPGPTDSSIASIVLFTEAGAPLPTSMKVGDSLSICGLYRSADGRAGMLAFSDTPADTVTGVVVDSISLADWAVCSAAARTRNGGVALTLPPRYALLSSSDPAVLSVGPKPRQSGVLPAPRRFLGRLRIG